MKYSVSVFKGGDTQYTLRRFRMYEGDNVMIPDGSVVLASEIVVEASTDVLQIEVWAAVPNDNMGVANGTKTVSDSSVNIKGEAIPETHAKLLELGAEYSGFISDEDAMDDDDEEDER